MNKVGFITLGCKVNIYESNALEELLVKEGYQIIEPSSLCDIFIINTCSVTNTADQKSRQMINRCRKLNPNAIVVAMGCYIQTSKNTDVDADIIIGNGNKDKVIDLIKAHQQTKQIDIIDIMAQHDYDNLMVSTYDHSRAFVKIEDGCNQFCTYCIIPYARGPIRSKPADVVIEEIKNIVANGFNEVVLSGIHTGKYNDKGLKLNGLIKRIISETGLKRLRLSSIEVNEIDDEIIELFRTSKVMANHFHIPLQAGSDTILKLMNRPYDTKYFKDKIELLRSIRPDIAITTDVMTGFPYEDDKLFNETVEFIKDINLTYLHVFPYSKRNGTKAALMPQVNGNVKKARANILNKLSIELRDKFYQENIGKVEEVLFEQREGNYLVGHTSNFILVKVDTDLDLIKQLRRVKLEEFSENSLIGTLID